MEHDGTVALRQQYDEALDLLNLLAERFVQWDKRRVIVVPGNHDVDARQFHRSLFRLRVEPGQTSEITRELFGPNSQMRRSWADLCCFEVDWPEYHRRFDAFREFYSEFYDGAREYA